MSLTELDVSDMLAMSTERLTLSTFSIWIVVEFNLPPVVTHNEQASVM
jgi:hypothetical protein